MLADLNIARKLSLLLILPMATFLFLVTVESMQRWKDIDELKFVVLPGFPWVAPVRNWPGRGPDHHRRSRWLS